MATTIRDFYTAMFHVAVINPPQVDNLRRLVTAVIYGMDDNPRLQAHFVRFESLLLADQTTDRTTVDRMISELDCEHPCGECGAYPCICR